MDISITPRSRIRTSHKACNLRERYTIFGNRMMFSWIQSLLLVVLSLFATAVVEVAECLSSTSTKNLSQKKAASNLLGICGHLQNEALYSPAWADACSIQTIVDPNHGNKQRKKRKRQWQRKCLVSSRSVEKGEALSLLPVHGIGKQGSFLLLTDNGEGTSSTLTSNQHHILDESSYHSHSPFIITKRDDDDNDDRKLFLVTDASRAPKLGWLGHLASGGNDEKSINVATGNRDGNCAVMPLAGAAPLCALVATDQIKDGTELILSSSSLPMGDITQVFMNKYETEISELRSYLAMAYNTPSKEKVIAANDKEMPESSKGTMNGEKEIEDDDDYILDTDNIDNESDTRFHEIDRSYPGLRVLHKHPDILAVDNFLTDDECNQIITMVTPHLVPCLTKDPKTGKVGPDPHRTSTNSNIPRRNVPSIVSKIKRLLGGNDKCNEECLEIFQVLRYKSGQKFERHTDGFRGPVDACGHVQSGRLVTLFVYLNDVAAGGETKFTKIGLNIKPRKGTAILHFPATFGLREDPRTEHEGAEATDDKWILVTWLWKHPRTDPVYAEENLKSLGDDII